MCVCVRSTFWVCVSESWPKRRLGEKLAGNLFSSFLAFFAFSHAIKLGKSINASHKTRVICNVNIIYK